MEEVIGDMMASKEKVGQLSHKLEVLDHDFTGLLAQLETVFSINAIQRQVDTLKQVSQQILSFNKQIETLKQRQSNILDKEEVFIADVSQQLATVSEQLKQMNGRGVQQLSTTDLYGISDVSEMSVCLEGILYVISEDRKRIFSFSLEEDCFETVYTGREILKVIVYNQQIGMLASNGLLYSLEGYALCPGYHIEAIQPAKEGAVLLTIDSKLAFLDKGYKVTIIATDVTAFEVINGAYVVYNTSIQERFAIKKGQYLCALGRDKDEKFRSKEMIVYKVSKAMAIPAMEEDGDIPF